MVGSREQGVKVVGNSIPIHKYLQAHRPHDHSSFISKSSAPDLDKKHPSTSVLFHWLNGCSKTQGPESIQCIHRKFIFKYVVYCKNIYTVTEIVEFLQV